MKSKTASILGIVLIFLFETISTFAQTKTNKEALEKISSEQATLSAAQKAEAVEYARLNGIPVSSLSEDGQFVEIQYIDAFGQPHFYITDNSAAAASISTNQVHPGGNAGLTLTGEGITLRVWDAGAVRTAHQELTGRVVMGDGSATLQQHSTHVAGTMMASGVKPTAKGMSPAAQLRAFDWNSDASEMAAEAANGALVSSHSYGYARGWYSSGGIWYWAGNTSISTQEDYLFGFYDAQAQSWDNVSFNAPYYLICKSAGNDRNEGPTGAPYPKDGPNDCIAHAGVGKNILTVGAVNDIPGGYTGPSSVVMTTFSSWGPVDDGRVKPDIVANGYGLYSTDKDNNTDYATLSGTSMSTPSVAGSLALLQEHWSELHSGVYMKASTLKALVLHTADEAGTANGPDYQFGWGLMNTRTAALKISEDQTFNAVDELVLNNGATYTRTVHSNGSEPLKVTIVWTDPAGTPLSPQLDPVTPMLVNDLDLRLTMAASTYYPWKLDRNNPNNAATNSSENNVDNVEMVYIASPAAGDYTITIDHDGTLSGGSQAFSIIIGGATEATPAPPVANFTADDTTPNVGQVVNFTDLSTNSPTTWSWTITPSTVSFVNGTAATSQNPQVTFDVAGIYSVELTVTNAFGTNTKTEANYVTASNPPPPCATNPNPVSGSTGVTIDPVLSWSAVTGADGYKVYFGTDNPPASYITQPGTSYTPGTLAYSTMYYWKVVPFNASGEATGCSTWSFTTENDPNYSVDYSESFEAGFGMWTQATNDQMDWTRWSGATPTSKTGPSGAYNGTYYIYTEATGNIAKEAHLTSTFNLTGIFDPEISIWYHMYGNQMGSLYVDASINNGSTWTNLWFKTGQQHTAMTKPFTNAVISLASYANQPAVILRIRGKVGSGERSDMAVDLVHVRQAGNYSPGGGGNPGHQNGENLAQGFGSEGQAIDFYCYDHNLVIRNLSGEFIKGRVTIYNVTGQIVQTFEMGGASDFTMSTGLETGLYIVRFAGDRLTYTEKVLIK